MVSKSYSHALTFQQPKSHPIPFKEPVLHKSVAAARTLDLQRLNNTISKLMTAVEISQPGASSDSGNKPGICDSKSVKQKATYQAAKNQYQIVTVPKLGDVSENNPNYRKIVGSTIFAFVQDLVKASAPRVTGLMIDLSVPEIKDYMQNYDIFVDRVLQVTKILSQSKIIN